MEPMKVHRLFNSTKERKEKVIDILKRVGLSEDYFNRYPHEFSGGQRQRIGIARTIALHPNLLFVTNLFLHLIYQFKHKF